MSRPNKERANIIAELAVAIAKRKGILPSDDQPGCEKNWPGINTRDSKEIKNRNSRQQDFIVVLCRDIKYGVLCQLGSTGESKRQEQLIVIIVIAFNQL